MIPSAPTGKKILIVDDDLLLREMLTLILAGEGYRVPTAANGREALERLHDAEPPDLILLDLMMFGTNGWEFRRRQQQDPKLASIPVIVLSAVDASRQEAAVPGAVAYLSKPVETQKLLDMIRNHLGAHEQLGAPLSLGRTPCD